ncbi:apolipoprotein N-acyltransferase [Neptunomonas qingdaonensis]|uniref:Apolipoprotein N-acyltransferase n=1 Tax=Neptunomonas qingdaonensis TaxID=1045558 RepID=A0A1I2N9S1_9GAMM|nr:apolipoprotein N-acyltransferase [Neptunomonas qingdaonensis]SFG00502.1 apolipoprotein N-acyltransferase [Neptunomonas qingdaonensis]
MKQLTFAKYRALISLFCGALTPLAFAPFDLWLLILITPGILYLLLQDLSPRRAAWISWCFGTGFFGTGVSWVYVSIHTYGNASVLLASIMTLAFAMGLALTFALQGWCYAKWLSPSRFSAAGFIGIWILFEWFRSWFLTGFPWLYLGYALIDSPFKFWAPLGGVWLLSLTVLCLSIGVIQLIKAHRTPRRIALAVLISLPCLALILPKDWTQSSGHIQQVDIVQANIPQQLKWDKNYLPEFLNMYSQITLRDTQASLVIWPETAIPSLLSSAKPYLSELLYRFDKDNRSLISGLPSIEADSEHPDGYRAHNSLAVLTGKTNIYHKQRLVPFGEYVPMETYLRGVIEFFNLPMSSFSLPAETQTTLRIGDMKIAAAICYEIAYPELVRQLSIHSDWILTVSNDTWFSHSLAPAQHLQIARMRALENGRWLVRSTNNGLTAIIDPYGDITAQAPAYQQAVLSGSIENRSGTTPYQKYGAAPVLLFSLLLLAACFIRRKKGNS